MQKTPLDLPRRSRSSIDCLVKVSLTEVGGSDLSEADKESSGHRADTSWHDVNGTAIARVFGRWRGLDIHCSKSTWKWISAQKGDYSAYRMLMGLIGGIVSCVEGFSHLKPAPSLMSCPRPSYPSHHTSMRIPDPCS